MSRPLRIRAYETLASIFIVAVLVGQVATLPFGIPRAYMFGWGGYRSWPIVSYYMYTQSRHEGDIVEAYHLMEATLANGQVVELTQQNLGLSVWDYRHLTAGLLADDPVALALVRRQHSQGADMVELRIKTFPVVLTRSGPKEQPPEVIKRVTLDVLTSDSDHISSVGELSR